MKLWRRNKKQEKEIPSFLKVGLIRLNARLITAANYLQRKTNHFSLRKKKILLLLFVTAFVTESIIVIIQSVSGKHGMPVAVTGIKTVRVELKENGIPKITKTEFIRIQKFKNYIDSLGATVEGAKLKDSFLHYRPHLMDSVNFLINLYLEQSKTILR